MARQLERFENLVSMFLTRAEEKGDADCGEVAVGASWQLSRSTSLYGELGKLWDLGGDARNSSDVNASVGVKVLW